MSSLMPMQSVASGLFAGADMRTRFAPALLKCSSALSRLVKKPVDSRTTSTSNFFLGVTNLAIEFPVDRIPFEQVRERFGVGEIVDRAHPLDLFLRHSAEHVAPDATEAIDCVVSHSNFSPVGFVPPDQSRSARK